MLVARAYSVLDKVVVEISCVHGTDVAGSHLVIREERGPGLSGQRAALRALADVADMAALLVESQRSGGPGDGVGWCEYGWASPSC